jgi:ABC-type transport system involved in cytochrome bd biosynthesis fused ATPase/permease subunit
MSKDALEPGREEAVRRAARTISVERYRLSDVDLELAPWRPVALAGPSGSGTSAIVLALLAVNGADARAVSPERLRGLLAWSPEQPLLFPASLRANLRLGRRTSRTGRSSACSPTSASARGWTISATDWMRCWRPGIIRSPAERCSGSARPGPC